MQQKNNKKIAKLEVRIPPEVKESFAEKCETQGKTVSETVREFIHQNIHNDNFDEEKHDVLKTNNRASYIKMLSIVSVITIVSIAITSSIIKAPILNTQPDPKIIKIFNKYDRDHNGLLTLSDFEEFKSHKINRIQQGKSKFVTKSSTDNKSLSFVTADEFSKKYNSAAKLAKYDLNFDGEVDINEFIESKPRLNYITWASFNVLDTNEDNDLSKEELLDYAQQWFDGYPSAKKRARLHTNARLWKLDADKNGQISLVELKKYQAN